MRTTAPAVRGAATDAEGAELLEDACREALSEIAGLGDLVERAGAVGPADGLDS